MNGSGGGETSVRCPAPEWIYIPAPQLHERTNNSRSGWVAVFLTNALDGFIFVSRQVAQGR